MGPSHCETRASTNGHQTSVAVAALSSQIHMIQRREATKRATGCFSRPAESNHEGDDEGGHDPAHHGPSRPPSRRGSRGDRPPARPGGARARRGGPRGSWPHRLHGRSFASPNGVLDLSLARRTDASCRRCARPLLGALLFLLTAIPGCSNKPAGAECTVDTECSGAGAVCLSNKCFQFVASCSEMRRRRVYGPLPRRRARPAGRDAEPGPDPPVRRAPPAPRAWPEPPARRDPTGPTGAAGPAGDAPALRAPSGPMGPAGPAPA